MLPPRKLAQADPMWIKDENMSQLIQELGLSNESIGDTHVDLPTLLGLLQRSVEKVRSLDAPRSAVISRADYHGEALKGHVYMKCQYEIHVLADEWTRVPLITSTAAIESTNVECTSDGNYTPVSKESIASVGTVGDNVGLLVQHKGVYVVTVAVYLPYLTTQQTGLEMAVPKAVHNSLEFVVPSSGVEIKATPLLGQQTIVEDNRVSVRGQFPPSDTLTVQWTEKVLDIGERKKKKIPVSLVAENNTLFTVGEGLLVAKTHLKYQISHGSVSRFDCLVDADARVINVEGPAIKRWDITHSPKGEKVLQVKLEYGLEDSYTMTIVTETEVGGTKHGNSSQHIDVQTPKFRCLNVTREKGCIAVEARSNVEVEVKDYKTIESSSSGGGITVVDVQELPQHLVSKAEHHVLVGFKYLEPNYSITLGITKHADVEVLIAVVDSAHVRIVQTEEGKRIVNVVAKVRNTQKQYLRASLPGNAQIWSAVVKGQPVKPAKDGEDVLLPLEKSSSKEGDFSNDSNFTLELTYLIDQLGDGDLARVTTNENVVRTTSEGPLVRLGDAKLIALEEKFMGSSGTLQFCIPQFDLPINHLFVSIWLPQNFTYKEFGGDMREIGRFTAVPPTPSQGTEVAPSAYEAQNRNRMRQHVMMKKKAKKGPAISSMKGSHMRSAPGGATYGMTPVKVDIPISGINKKFEQQLVVSTSLQLSVDYNRVEKGYFQSRKV